MKNKIKKIIILLLLGVTNNLYAQEYERVNGFWNATFLDLPISDKVSIRSEFHFRTTSYFKIWDQQLYRPQLSYNPSKNVSWRAGYTYIKGYNRDRSAEPRVRAEHNLWEQVQFTVPLKKSSFSTWIRLEHRFQEELPLQMNNEMRSFDFSSRLRFRLTYQKSLSKSDTKTKWNLVVYDEIFSILNRKGIPFKFNQNWTFLGFNIKFNEKANLVTGFQKNMIAKPSNTYLINRFWNSTLFYKL